jgi:hypothetical protein
MDDNQQGGLHMEPVNSRIGRPFIAKSYGIAAGDAGLMDWSWVDAQMANSRNYWIGSTRPDGRPHVSPVWGVWLGGALYFGGDVQARRSRNLAANPQVVAHLESGDEVVMIEGVVEAVREMARLRQVAAALASKYAMPEMVKTFDDPDVAVCYRVKAQTVFAWLENDYPNTATRWVFD